MEPDSEDTAPPMTLLSQSLLCHENTVRLPIPRGISIWRIWGARQEPFSWLETKLHWRREWCFKWGWVSFESIFYRGISSCKFLKGRKGLRLLWWTRMTLESGEIQRIITLWVKTPRWATSMRRLHMMLHTITARAATSLRMWGQQTGLGSDYQLKGK